MRPVRYLRCSLVDRSVAAQLVTQLPRVQKSEAPRGEKGLHDAEKLRLTTRRSRDWERREAGITFHVVKEARHPVARVVKGVAVCCKELLSAECEARREKRCSLYSGSRGSAPCFAVAALHGGILRGRLDGAAAPL